MRRARSPSRRRDTKHAGSVEGLNGVGCQASFPAGHGPIVGIRGLWLSLGCIRPSSFPDPGPTAEKIFEKCRDASGECGRIRHGDLNPHG